MVEGGQYPWKIQKIDMSRGPVGDYSNIKSPLPDPPENMIWKFNKEAKEWKLVPDDGSTDTNGNNIHVQRSTSSYNSTSDEEEKEEQQQMKYVEHMVLPTDTLQGLCLKYKITATKLRQANRFSGSNLLLAPAKLKIPLVDGVVVHRQDVESPEYKIHSLRAELPQLGESEARSYLKFAEWNLQNALQEAKEDLKWEEMQKNKNVARGIVGTYVDLQHQRRLQADVASNGTSTTMSPTNKQAAETAIPVYENTTTNTTTSPTRKEIPKFTQSAMSFFHSQDDAGMEMNPMMVPLLSSDKVMS